MVEQRHRMDKKYGKNGCKQQTVELNGESMEIVHFAANFLAPIIVKGIN